MFRVVRPHRMSANRGGWCGVNYLAEVASIGGLMLLVLVLVTNLVLSTQHDGATAEEPAGPPVYAIGFVGNSPHLWVNQLFSGVREIDLKTSKTLAEWPAFSRSLYKVARGGEDIVTTAIAESIGVLRLIRGDEIVLNYEVNTNGNSITGIDVSSDGNLVVATHQRGLIVEWNWQSARFEATPAQTNYFIEKLCLSPDGRYLLLGVHNTDIVVWDRAAQCEVWRMTAHPRRLSQIGWMPDAERFITCGDDGLLRIWSLSTRQQLWEAVADPLTPAALAVSRDGRQIAVGGFGKLIRVWNADSGELLDTLPGHTSTIRSLAFDPTGETLVSGDLDGHIRIWPTPRLPELPLNSRLAVR